MPDIFELPFKDSDELYALLEIPDVVLSQDLFNGYFSPAIMVILDSYEQRKAENPDWQRVGGCKLNKEGPGIYRLTQKIGIVDHDMLRKRAELFVDDFTRLRKEV